MTSLRYKMLIIIIPLFLVLGSIGALTIHNKILTEQNLIIQRFEMYSGLLESGDLAFETVLDKTRLEKIFNEKIAFSKIVNKNFEILYSTENELYVFNPEEQEAINDAFTGIETRRIIYDKYENKQILIITSPLVINGRVVAVLHKGLFNEKAQERIVSYGFLIIIVILIGIGISASLILLLLNYVVIKKISILKDATVNIQEGKFDNHIEVKTNDEIGLLAKHFESMRHAIHFQKKQLEQYNLNLETKIKQRTAELEVKNNELERFNKLAVGRELKMIELKQKIKDLESEQTKN